MIKHKKKGSLDYLGLTIERAMDGILYCHQKGCIKDLLEPWGMLHANPARTTGDPDSYKTELARQGKLQSDERTAEDKEVVRKKAQAIIGGLLWLTTRTRPDLAYQVGHAATLVQQHPDEAVAEAKHSLRYVKGTAGKMLRLTPDQAEKGLEVYADASFAPTGKSSPTGVVILWMGVCIAWRASRTCLIVQSVCEAELVAILDGFVMSAGIRECVSMFGGALPEGSVI